MFSNSIYFIWFPIKSSNILALGRISTKFSPPELFVSPARILLESDAFKGAQLEVPPTIFEPCPTLIFLKQKHSWPSIQVNFFVLLAICLYVYLVQFWWTIILCLIKLIKILHGTLKRMILYSNQYNIP